MYCDFDSLVTESDVEQKFIYPLLVGQIPNGLGFRDSDIQTKHALRPRTIGKGVKRKIYFPDYLITMRGLPLLVVEAKAPGEDLGTAFGEARLYAAEVNASFPHGVNVCNKIVVCNGAETWAGFSDHIAPCIKLSFTDFAVENVDYARLLDFCSKDELLKVANQPYVKSRGKAIFYTPVWSLGGKRVQDEELVENAYGRTLVFENRNIFDPQSEDDRIQIVKNAYVPSSKREQHIEPMFREIKKIKLPNQINSTLISTSDPRAMAGRLSRHVREQEGSYSLFLIIGGVGSGKSTFVRYFKDVVMIRDYPDLSAKCEWIIINMNPAPVNKDEIYKWIKGSINRTIEDNHKEIVFTDIATLKRVFRVEIGFAQFKGYQNGSQRS